jgi:hypothetical protein
VITLKRPLDELQFGTEFETFVPSVQKLCSIENFSFSNLNGYNSKTGEFWGVPKWTDRERTETEPKQNRE